MRPNESRRLKADGPRPASDRQFRATCPRDGCEPQTVDSFEAAVDWALAHHHGGVEIEQVHDGPTPSLLERVLP